MPLNTVKMSRISLALLEMPERAYHTAGELSIDSALILKDLHSHHSALYDQ